MDTSPISPVVAGDTQEPVWLTVKEAAARARCSPKMLYRAARAHRLRHAKIGGRGDLRFRPDWIDSWLEQTVTPVEVK